LTSTQKHDIIDTSKERRKQNVRDLQDQHWQGHPVGPLPARGAGAPPDLGGSGGPDHPPRGLTAARPARKFTQTLHKKLLTKYVHEGIIYTERNERRKQNEE